MPAKKASVPWNKGTGKGWVDQRGYRWVYVARNGRNVARREHRVIVEQHIGRDLEPWELVHHKNGDKSDNRIENLEIKEFGEHATLHSTNRRHAAEAKRRMEAFALMREELKRERQLSADLLEALEGVTKVLADAGEGDGSPQDEWESALSAARAAIAKARGEDHA